MMNKILLIVGLLWYIIPVFAQHGQHKQLIKPKENGQHTMHSMGDTVKTVPELQHAHEVTTKKYTCPMHLEIIADKPGKCPKCGMDLVPTSETAIELPPENTDTISVGGKTVRYDLCVTHTMANYTGKMAHALAINDSLPAPTLYFTEGDTAAIYLHNNLKKEETSLHWHGVILPNRFDGVPYLTSKRIGPGESFLYKFKVVQNGTYWYHSHSGLQEQIGMYGVLVFRKKPGQGNQKKYAADIPVMLSDWSNEHPHEIMRRLHTASDWYAIKKKSVQSYAEAIKAGHLGTKLLNEWKRMNAMDVSDVYYDKFLINGQPSSNISTYNGTILKAGDRVRLRVVNGGASSYFWLTYGGGKITVIASDGNEIKPVMVDRLIVGVSETYDVLVTIPENKSYEFRATPEDRTQFASLWLGAGDTINAPALPRLNYFEGMKMMNSMMKMNGDMKPMGMHMHLQKMDMNSVMYPELQQLNAMYQHANTNIYTCPMHPEVIAATAGKCPKCGMNLVPQAAHQMSDMNPNSSGHQAHAIGHEEIIYQSGDGPVTLNYDMLQSTHTTAFPTDVPIKNLHFSLEGNMNRYLWTLNNKTVTEADKILIKKGEVIRIILTNNSMMRHPMHLHGHDFRIVNSKGDNAPFKNVLDIMPMETDTLELAANQDGDWFFHCHILYHMMAGMGRVLSYQNSPPNPDLPDARKAWQLFKKDNRMNSFTITAGLETNGSDGEFMWMSQRYALQGLWHLGYKDMHGYEGELNFGRYLDKMQWLYPYIGYDYHYQKRHYNNEEKSRTWFGQVSNKQDRHSFVAGVQYTLPWLVIADARVDREGKFRLQFMRQDIALTPRLRMNIMANSDREYMAGLQYIIKKWFAVSSHYDSDMGWGAGITVIY